MQRVLGKMMLKAVTGIVLTVLLVGMLMSAFNVQPVKAEPLWLYYDDGELNGGSGWPANYTSGPCVLFDIPLPNYFQIQSANICIASNEGYPFRLFVYVYNTSILAYEKAYEGITDALYRWWTIIDLTSYNIITNSSFIIGVTWVRAEGPTLGFDHDTSCHSGRFDTSETTTFYNHEADKNYMIRAEIEPTPVGGIWIPVDKLALLAPYIALASTILVATAATAIYVKHAKRRKKKQ